MKYEVTSRDHLESLLVAIPILLGVVSHLFNLFGADTRQDLLIIGLIGAFIAIYKKQMATWFLNLAKERQEHMMMWMIRISSWLIAGMYVVTLGFVLSKRFFT